MNTFQIGSFQLRESKKWVPAGTLFSNNGDSISIQPIEFAPEHRFDTEEEANNFFRNYYKVRGYIEKS